MALSEFQLKKIAVLFNFWDGNNNGHLDKGDYTRIADRLADFRGWAEGTDEYNAVHTTLQEDWAEAANFADTNKDNRITLDEWNVFCDTFIHNEEMYQVTVNNVRQAVIEAVDLDDDGIIDVNDWRNVFKIYSYDESLAEESFKMMDRDADGKVTGDEIAGALNEFLQSNDKSASGNYMFGPVG